VWKVDLEGLRVDLNNGTQASVEKRAQVVDQFGVAEPQSHPQGGPLVFLWPHAFSLTLREGQSMSRPPSRWAELLSRRGLKRPYETLVAWAREA
jgi:hypothetical protein